MTDIDLDRLGDVWRQQPDPAELERLHRAAEAVRRRGRWRNIVDVVAALVVGGVVLYLGLRNPERSTIVVGACAIMALLYGLYRQRRLREQELRSLTGSAEEMIGQSIARIETTVRHHRMTMIAIGPAFAVAILFSAASDTGTLLAPWRDTPWFRFIWVGSWLALVVLFVLYLISALRKSRGELKRLYALRDAYAREKNPAASDLPIT